MKLSSLSSIMQAVIKAGSFDANEVINTASHGCVSGSASAFIYYCDTVKFYDANKDLIIEALEELKDEAYGDEYSMFSMLQSFGGAKSLEVVTAEYEYDEEYDEYSDDVNFDQSVMFEIDDFDYCGKKAFAEDDCFKNLLTWVVVEQTCSYLADCVLEDDGIDGLEELGIDCEDYKKFN